MGASAIFFSYFSFSTINWRLISISLTPRLRRSGGQNYHPFGRTQRTLILTLTVDSLGPSSNSRFKPEPSPPLSPSLFLLPSLHLSFLKWILSPRGLHPICPATGMAPNQNTTARLLQPSLPSEACVWHKAGPSGPEEISLTGSDLRELRTGS